VSFGCKLLNISKTMMVAGGLIAFAALSACAAPTSYMGIDFASASAGVEQAEIGSLARRAQAGDKQAQLELGIRFEERWRAAVRGTDGKPSRGVERDLNKARKLYAKAASNSGGTIWVYSPPVGNGTKGRTIPVNTGPKQVGLAEAKRRLERVE